MWVRFFKVDGTKLQRKISPANRKACLLSAKLLIGRQWCRNEDSVRLEPDNFSEPDLICGCYRILAPKYLQKIIKFRDLVFKIHTVKG